MCAAWATISPSLLKTAHEKSLLSLILGENAVLFSVTPISSEMEENLFLNTSNKIGLTFTIQRLRPQSDTSFCALLTFTGKQYEGIPTAGFNPMIKALVVTIFGGLGSVKGTIWAAYIIGLLEAFLIVYVGASFALPGLFLFMIVMLVIRPNGLFGLGEMQRL